MADVTTPTNGQLENASETTSNPPGLPHNRLPEQEATVKPDKPAKPDNGLRDKSSVKWTEDIVIAGFARKVSFGIQVETEQAHKPEAIAKAIEGRTDDKGKPLDIIGKWSYLRADGSTQRVKTPREPALAAKAYRRFAGLPHVG